MTAQNLQQIPILPQTLSYEERPQYGYDMLQRALDCLNFVYTRLDKLKELITEAA